MILLSANSIHYGHGELFFCVVETMNAWDMNPFETFMGSYNQLSLSLEMTYKVSFQNCNCSIVLDCFYFQMGSVLWHAQVCISVMPGKPVRKENIQAVGLLSRVQVIDFFKFIFYSSLKFTHHKSNMY